MKTKHWVYIAAGLLFFAVIAGIVSSRAADRRRQALYIINYAQYAVFKLTTYNNIFALEEEYSNLYDNMNLETVRDNESVNIIKALADSIYSERKNHKDRERMEASLKRHTVKALYNSLEIPKSGGGPAAAQALSMAASAGNIFVSYLKEKDKLKEEYDGKMYSLQQQTTDNLNSLYGQLMQSTKSLMDKYSIPESWRVNQKALENEFLRFINGSDPQKTYQAIKSYENREYFQHFPIFWHHLARAAADAGDEKNAIRYYSRFEKENSPIFKTDRIASDAYKGKIVLLLKSGSYSKNEILQKLKYIENAISAGWEDRYFCALVYSELGRKRDAERLLKDNINKLSLEIDDKFVIGRDLMNIKSPGNLLSNYYDALEINNIALLDIKNARQKDDILKAIEEAYRRNTAAFNQVLYLFGFQPLKNIVNNSREDIKKTLLSFRPGMRKSCQMEVQIPVQWVLSSATELNALFSGEGENKSFALPLDEKSSAKLNKKSQCSDKCSLVYSAEKIEIDLEKYKFAGIELKHPKYPILFKYEINPKKSAKNISPSKIFFAGEEYSVE